MNASVRTVRSVQSAAYGVLAIAVVASVGQGARTLRERVDREMLMWHTNARLHELASSRVSVLAAAGEAEALLAQAMRDVPRCASPEEGAAFVAGVVEDVATAAELTVSSTQAIADSAFADAFSEVGVQLTAVGSARAVFEFVTRVEEAGYVVRRVSLQPLAAAEGEALQVRTEATVAALVRRDGGRL